MFENMDKSSHVFRSMLEIILSKAKNHKRRYFQIYRDSELGLKVSSGYFNGIGLEQVEGEWVIRITQSFGIFWLRVDELVDYDDKDQEEFTMTFVIKTKV